MGDREVTMWRVVLPYACYSVDSCNGRIVDAAPIARWMIGKKTYVVRDWVRSKGGTFKRLGIWLSKQRLS